jgi:hypothetical protein
MPTHNSLGPDDGYGVKGAETEAMLFWALLALRQIIMPNHYA